MTGRVDLGAVAATAEEAGELERLGFGFVGQGDHLATFTGLLDVARATERVRFGSFILTPYGRHPAVTAMECSRIQRASGGRLVLAIGRGFRSAAMMGRPPVSLGATREYVMAVRGLLRGESVTFEGTEVPPLTGTEPVPVLLSAYGPAVRRLAGEVADGVVLAAGSDLAQALAFLADVAQGAARAGRSMADLDVWMLCRGSVRPGRADALDDLRGLLAAAAYRHLRAPAQLATIPAEHHEALAELHRRYDPVGPEGYQPSWDGPNARLVSELQLDELLAGRFAIVGTPDDCRRQVAALGELGVSRIVLAPGARDGDTQYERLAEALVTAS